MQAKNNMCDKTYVNDNRRQKRPRNKWAPEQGSIDQRKPHLRTPSHERKQTRDITSFLCDIREYLSITNQIHIIFTKSLKTDNNIFPA